MSMSLQPPLPPALATVAARGAGEWLVGVAGVRYLVRLSAEQTGGELAIIECVLAPGALRAAPHVHHDHAEHFQVVSGEVVFDVGEEVVAAGPDTWVSIPRECAHGFRNASAADALLRCVVTRAGYENYFREVAAAIGRGEDLDGAALARLRLAYGTDTL